MYTRYVFSSTTGFIYSWIFWPPSDDAQDYSLNSKYLTKDCDNCRCFIQRPSAQWIVAHQSLQAPKWTAPNMDTIEGLCMWGKFAKVLEQRPKGPRKCEFFGKRRRDDGKRWPLPPED